MRLIGALIVLAVVLFLAVTNLMGSHVAAQKHAPVTGANARGIVDQAQRQLQQNESAGQGSVQRGINAAGGGQP